MIKAIRIIIAVLMFVPIAFQYGYSEDAFATDLDTDGDYQFRIIKDGGLKLGDGTPTVTQNGEDAYIEGTLEVDGAVRFDGAVTLTGTVSPSAAFVIPTVDVTITTPTVAGMMVKTSAYEVYIATATTGIAAWSKVGGQ